MAKLNKDQQILLVSLTAIFVVIAAVVSSVYYQNKYSTLKTEFDNYKQGFVQALYAVGEVIETQEFKLVVNEAKVNQVGIPDYLPVPDGMQYVTVDLSLTNKTESEEVLIPLNEVYLRDAEGNKYELTSSPDVKSTVAGRVSAGDTVKGQVGFLVPSDAENLRFYYEPLGAVTPVVVVDLALN